MVNPVARLTVLAPAVFALSLSALAAQAQSKAMSLDSETKLEVASSSSRTVTRSISSKKLTRDAARQVALSTYAQFKDGLHVYALETLFEKVQDPKKVPRRIWQAWAKVAPAKHPAWQAARLNWSYKWTRTFPHVKQAGKSPVQIRKIRTKADFKKSLRYLSRLNLENNDLARGLFQLSVHGGNLGQVKTAMSLLNKIEALKQTALPKDQLSLHRARLLYKAGQLKKSSAEYNKIPNTSPYWIEAIEEDAYAKARQKSYGPALAKLHTLNTSVVSPYVGPEPLFLTSLVNMKICNFNHVLNNLATFKKKFLPRAIQLEKLAEKNDHSATAQLIRKVEAGQDTWKGLGAGYEQLPRSAFRDARLKRSLLSRRHLLREVNIVRTMLRRGSEPLSYVVDGLLLKDVARRYTKAGQDIHRRITQMSKSELRELAGIINKMRLVEVEVIQRIHAELKLGRTKQKFKKVSSDKMVFVKNSEDWLDELDNYEVQVKNCKVGG